MALFVSVFKLIAPIFIIVSLGAFLRYRGMLTDRFVTTASQLVFQTAMPALIFLKISNAPLHELTNLTLMWVSLSVFATYSLGLMFMSRYYPAHQAVFIQAGFRSNFGIIGLSIAWLLWGTIGLSKAALLLAVVSPLYNVSSIIIFNYYNSQASGPGYWESFVKTPLLWGALLGIVFAYYSWEVPPVAEQTLQHISALALPLALIGIGATCTKETIRSLSRIHAVVCLLKLVIAPALAVSIGIAMGLTGMDLGIVFLLMATPTAVASFIVAQTFSTDAKLAGSLVVVTTILSSITLPIGIALLVHGGWLSV
ncbi:AEC family transporter [Candidatus Marinamargulisbacteria bacterium]|nr:hypothetical protein [bacterium]MDA7563900.1 AEC family transporter [Candidatus Marinamargulisbacteria bacterium]|tara:strand:- start:856 stop:1788 length:933 start_codon:yes stop_codon:yes gene_type:complete